MSDDITFINCYNDTFDLCNPELELSDPNPDIHQKFLEYDSLFFDGVLQARCCVRWSTRMTLCAGTCAFDGQINTISLSKPLLSLRPRSDFINTLLHEMIHAYLFLKMNMRQRDGKDGHGPIFQSHMHRINKLAGTQITIYHTFKDEVENYRKHVWQCTGICRTWKPYYGLVKRSMNRPPQKADPWFAGHQAKCGGTFIKISEPEKKSKNLKNSSKNPEKVEAQPKTSSSKKVLKDQTNLPKKRPPDSKVPEITKFFDPTAESDSKLFQQPTVV